MDKAGDAYRTISEVAEELDLPQHVLRFWETKFREIKPMKRGGGRRYYRPDDFSLLTGIKHLLYGEGYTIKGVQRILKELGPNSVRAAIHGDASESLQAFSDEKQHASKKQTAAESVRNASQEFVENVDVEPKELQNSDYGSERIDVAPHMGGAAAQLHTLHADVTSLQENVVQGLQNTQTSQNFTPPTIAPQNIAPQIIKNAPEQNSLLVSQNREVSVIRGGLTKEKSSPTGKIDFVSNARKSNGASAHLGAVPMQNLVGILNDLQQARLKLDKILSQSGQG